MVAGSTKGKEMSNHNDETDRLGFYLLSHTWGRTLFLVLLVYACGRVGYCKVNPKIVSYGVLFLFCALHKTNK